MEWNPDIVVCPKRCPEVVEYTNVAFGQMKVLSIQRCYYIGEFHCSHACTVAF